MKIIVIWHTKIPVCIDLVEEAEKRRSVFEFVSKPWRKRRSVYEYVWNPWRQEKLNESLCLLRFIVNNPWNWTNFRCPFHVDRKAIAKLRPLVSLNDGETVLKGLCHGYCACLHLTDANDVNKAMFIWTHVKSRLALRNLHRDSLLSLEPFTEMSLSSEQSRSFAVCIRVLI